jgi:Family of unknown function (DUF5871)
MALDLANLSLGEVYVSPKGGKTAALSINGAPVQQRLPAMEVLFEPRSFDGSEQNRVGICFRPPADAVTWLEAVDKAILALAQGASVALFGKELTPDQLAERYVSALKRQGNLQLFRAKITKTGPAKTRCWRNDGRVDAPAFWQGSSVTPIVSLKSVWLSKTEFGPIFDVTDCLVEASAAEECPFR